MKKFAVVAALAVAVSVPASASAEPPDAGSKICTPGKTNVGGGGGNSGPGDNPGGAPLKPAPSCPGPDN